MAYILKQKTVQGSIDLCYASSSRVEGKKYPVQTRKYLGQLDTETGEILKNRKLPCFSSDELKALKKAGIVFNGRETSNPGRKPKAGKKIPLYLIRQWRSLELGRVAVMRSLAEKCGLFNALNDAFGEGDALSIFTLALFQCTENSALYRAENWIEDTVLAEDTALSKSSIARLTVDLGSNEAARSAFFVKWIQECKYPKALIHDTTSISSYAEKISMIEYGYNRDREKLPQLNFALVYTAKEQLPLFFRLIHGSVPDVSTLSNTSRLLTEYGLEDFSYALDRGYYSKANILEMLERNISFTIGVPLFVSEIKKLIDKHRSRLDKIESGLLVGDQNYRYAKDILQIRKDGSRGRSYKLGVHIFVNLRRRARLINELDTLLLLLQKQFMRENFASRTEALEWCEENFPAKSKLYVISGQKKLKLSISEEAYAEKIKNLGLFVVLNSDHKAEALTTLYTNRGRDAVEKLFDVLKNSTHNRRMYAASDNTAHGKMFIAFIAVILHSLIENQLRKYELTDRVNVNQAFDLLRKIRVGISGNGQEALLEIPSKTRKLLESMNITLPKM